MSGQKLTCTFYVEGKQVDKLTPEQTERMAQKVGEVMSIYYTGHHDEYKKMQSAECRIKN